MTKKDLLKLKRLKGWWYEARQKHYTNRRLMAEDEAFYDGDQWNKQDIDEMLKRNQFPFVFNEILTAIKWILGTEERTKMHWKVYPRSDDDVELAITKNKLLKYVEDANKAEFVRAEAFKEAVVAGLGWLELGINTDAEKEILFIKQESWRNIWLDPTSKEIDLSDAKYIFRSKIIDLKTAQKKFPQMKDELAKKAFDLNSSVLEENNVEDDYHDIESNQAAESEGVLFSSDLEHDIEKRLVVRLIECWYRELADVQILRHTPKYEGIIFDPNNEEMNNLVQHNFASLTDSQRQVVRTAVFIEGGDLCYDRPSPYRHNRFPFVPIKADTKKENNMPYGVVRNIKDAQRSLNKHRSKALWIMSTNQTVMEDGAVSDIDDYAEEVADPSGIIVKKKGYDLQINRDNNLSVQHVNLARVDSEHIKSISGVTAENLGTVSNVTAGVAIQAKQNQGTVVTAGLFKNYRLSYQLSGEIELSLTEQFYTDQKVFRLTGERGKPSFITINQMTPEGIMLNDITSIQSDFIVDQDSYRESLRITMFEQLLNALPNMPPEFSTSLFDLVFELSDLPNKDEIVKRIRKVNGQIDPDDEQAEQKILQTEAQQAQEAQRQAQINTQMILAELKQKQAEANKKQAESRNIVVKTMAEALGMAEQLDNDPQHAVIAQDLVQGADLMKQES